MVRSADSADLWHVGSAISFNMQMRCERQNWDLTDKKRGFKSQTWKIMGISPSKMSVDSG